MYYSLKDVLHSLLRDKRLKKYKNEIDKLLTPESLLSKNTPITFFIHQQNYDIFVNEITLSNVLETIYSSYNVLLKQDAFSSIFYKEDYFQPFETSKYKDYLIEYEKIILELHNRKLQKDKKVEAEISKKIDDDKKSKILKTFPKINENDKVVILQFETKRFSKVKSFGLTIIENGKKESYFYKIANKQSESQTNHYKQHPYINGSGYFIDDDAINVTLRSHLKNAVYLMSYDLDDTLNVFSSYEYDLKQNNTLQLFDLNDIKRPYVYIKGRRTMFLTLLHHFKVEYGNVVNMGNKSIYLADVVTKLNKKDLI